MVVKHILSLLGFGSTPIERRLSILIEEKAVEAFDKWRDGNEQIDIEAFFSSNRRKIGAGMKRFKQINREAVTTAFETVIGKSQTKWFASEFPPFHVNAAPLIAVKTCMLPHVEGFFEGRIPEFHQFYETCRKALVFASAVEAIEKQATPVINRLAKKKSKIAGYNLVELHTDLYKFDTETMFSTEIIFVSATKFDKGWDVNSTDRNIDRNFSRENYEFWKSHYEFDGGYEGLSATQ